MTSCCNKFISLFSQECTRMTIIPELIALAIINKHDADIITYMTVTNNIHIIEESQITKHSNKQLIRMNK